MSSRASCAPPTASRSPNPAWDSARPDPATSSAPYRIYNIGNHSPVELMHFIGVLEKDAGARGQEDLPARCNRVTCRRLTPTSMISWPTSALRPATPIEEGIARFVKWYRDHYGA